MLRCGSKGTVRTICVLGALCALVLASCSQPGLKSPAPGKTPRSAAPPVAVAIPLAVAGPHSTYHEAVVNDTLYSIAWRYRLDYRELARWNSFTGAEDIQAGDRIRIKPTPELAAVPLDSSEPTTDKRPGRTYRIPTPVSPGRIPDEPRKGPLVWRWPTSSSPRLFATESSKDRFVVHLPGTIGMSIRAAADGRVVYSGSGLSGYRKLIIIKHSERLFSSYEQSRPPLVREGDRVVAGQIIARMGSKTDKRPILFFEIRKDGESADPFTYLPPR